jgi:single-stranded-DNA-specific exonuclease
MVTIPKRWIYKTPDAALVSEMSEKLGVSKAVASVLVNRGIDSVKEAELFLNPDIKRLNNPFLLPDINKAVARIRLALGRKEKILVYGDRDVDGVTSTCIMVRTLKSLGGDVLWYVPSNEGYGLNIDVIKNHAEMKARLIITVDCGVTALKEVQFANSLGIDVVVTDHHEPTDDGLPAASAIVDPKLKGSQYPFLDIAGCAVTFKVCQALMLSYGRYFDKELAALDFSGDTVSVAVFKNAGIEKQEKFNGLGDGLAALVSGKTVVVKDESALQKATKLLGGDRKFVTLPAPATDEVQGAAALAEYFIDLEAKNDLRMNFFASDNLDLVALGTIADIMPLSDENRVLVTEGLKYLSNTKKPGLRALLEVCLRKKNDESALSAKSVSWDITPILNAAGRRGRADLSVKLIFCDDVFDCHTFLDQIVELNNQRKELQAENMEVFTSLVSQQCDIDRDKILIITATGIEHGVTGIVASHLMRKFNRPVLLLILEKEEAVGAARSMEGFDMVSAFDSLKDILVKYGGHSQAAGVTVSKTNIEEFTRRLREIAEREINYEMLSPTIEIDAELNLADIGMELLDDLAKLEPFGTGNPHPIFSLSNVRVKSYESLGSKNEHLKLKINKNDRAVIEVLGWGLGPSLPELKKSAALDLAVQLEYNNWKSKKSLQLVICDVKTRLI